MQGHREAPEWKQEPGGGLGEPLLVPGVLGLSPAVWSLFLGD